MRTKTHTSNSLRKHRGFTAIELMIAIGVMAATAGLTIPMFRQFQTQADIDTATESLVQALRAAQTLSQSGKADSAWGVYFPDGILFSGDEYAVRSEERDVTFTIPPSIETSGLDETSFTKIDGLPTKTGVVHVTSSVTGGYRTITIDQNGVIVVSGIHEGNGSGTSSGGSTGGSTTGGTTGSTTGGTTGGDTAGTTGGDTGGTTGGTTGSTTGGTTGGDTSGTTGGTTGGDTAGTTGGTTGSTTGGTTGGDTSGTTGGTTGGGSSSSASSSNGSSASSSSSASSVPGGSGGAGGLCGVNVVAVSGAGCGTVGQFASAKIECYDGSEKEIEDDTCRTSMEWQAMGNSFCEGRCSGDISCETRFKIDDDKGTIRSIGTNDVKLKVLGSQSTYGGTNQKIGVRVAISTDEGNSWEDLFGGKNVEGNEQHTIENVALSQSLKIRVNGRYSWLFNKSFRSDGEDGHIVALKNGDALPNYVQLRNVTGLPTFLKNVVDAQGKVAIGPKDVLYITELNALDSNARFQDLAILATFSGKAYSCSDASKPRLKISFKRLQNTGNGDMQNKVFVGPGKVAFAEEQWIPLVDVTGRTIIDGGLVEDVRGFAVERGDGWVKILNHGSHPEGSGKEIVDARVLFNQAYITTMENDVDQNKSENPTDGMTNDTSGGDEFVPGPNAKSMTFKTRVTSADDAVILRWNVGEPNNAISSAVSSSSMSSSASVEGAGDICYVSYRVNPDTNFIELSKKADVTVRIVGSEATYGKRGPKVSVRARITFDGGRTWQNVNAGRVLRGNELVVFRDIAADSKIAIEYNGRYSWAFNRTVKSTDGNDSVKVLKKGQTATGLAESRSSGNMKKFLKDLVDSDAKMKLTDRDVAILGDLSDERTKSYNDVVTVISIDKARSDGGCATSSSTSSSSSSSVSTSMSSSSAGNLDTDNDSVKNSDDWCPFNTKFPEAVPTEYMSFDRYALTSQRGNPNSTPVFRTGPRKSVSSYSIKDLHGCSCEQILDAIEDKGLHRFEEHPVLLRKLKNLFGFVISNSRKFGCSNSIMQMIKDSDE